ncbi:hypothetical protein ACFVUW_21565 [Streptomyces xiamenensis]|uniref:hypothetical protein n=1 Tax=Streptomyces xiamenensis TaxID=408015 RepID=UPI0036F0D3B4
MITATCRHRGLVKCAEGRRCAGCGRLIYVKGAATLCFWLAVLAGAFVLLLVRTARVG